MNRAEPRLAKRPAITVTRPRRHRSRVREEPTTDIPPAASAAPGYPLGTPRRRHLLVHRRRATHSLPSLPRARLSGIVGRCPLRSGVPRKTASTAERGTGRRREPMGGTIRPSASRHSRRSAQGKSQVGRDTAAVASGAPDALFPARSDHHTSRHQCVLGARLSGSPRSDVSTVASGTRIRPGPIPRATWEYQDRSFSELFAYMPETTQTQFGASIALL